LPAETVEGQDSPDVKNLTEMTQISILC